MKKDFKFLAVIFLFAFVIRLLSVWPANTIIGFDQARDLFDAAEITKGDIRIIGPTAGNNPNLHHGVAWLYFLAIPLTFSHNPIAAVIWNCLFNALAAVVIFYIAKLLYGSKKVGLAAAIITSVSYYYVEFSGWLSNPTGVLFTLPFFILGVLLYTKGKRWALPLATFFLGLTIEFELFFIYLIPISLVLWLILKPKLPSIKLTIVSIGAFAIATSTMILTELKFGFAGIKSILGAGQFVGGSQTNLLEDVKIFLVSKWETFYLNVTPQFPQLGTLIAVVCTLILAYEILSSFRRRSKKGNILAKSHLFVLVLFFSPAVMFVLGIHNAPWFYIGRPLFAILIASYVLSKIKSNFLFVALSLAIIFANLVQINSAYGKGQPLLEPDNGAILSTQIKAMEYTYQIANGEPFAIDTVTNPLYINATWAWNYDWYYKKYGYRPHWLGGDQIPPYNTLEKATGQEKYLFVIADQTERIPPVYTQNALKNLDKKGKLIDQKDFSGITVFSYLADTN